MKNKIFLKLSSVFSLCLVAIAGISVSTSTALLWHEVECPEELIKK